MSRFNHSCQSNAEYRWNEKTDSREVRVVYKIHPGDEITINYAWNHSMSSFKTRQEKLLNWGFECQCDRCDKEKFDQSDAELCMKFDQIKNEAQNIQKLNKIDFSIENVMKELVCYEQMYKIAKGKKARLYIKGWPVLNTTFEHQGFELNAVL